MLTVLRHLLAILLLPVVVTIGVPSWLLDRFADIDTRWRATSALAWPVRGLGAVLLAGGSILFAWCVVLVARLGAGTLAPWAPTQRLVAVAPYRSVRKPMLSGVAAVLSGQVRLTGSRFLALWLLVWVAIKQAYFLLLEEPGLERRFGESYR